MGWVCTAEGRTTIVIDERFVDLAGPGGCAASAVFLPADGLLKESLWLAWRRLPKLRSDASD
jgi:hypothetical protein